MSAAARRAQELLAKKARRQGGLDGSSLPSGGHEDFGYDKELNGGKAAQVGHIGPVEGSPLLTCARVEVEEKSVADAALEVDDLRKDDDDDSGFEDDESFKFASLAVYGVGAVVCLYFDGQGYNFGKVCGFAVVDAVGGELVGGASQAPGHSEKFVDAVVGKVLSSVGEMLQPIVMSVLNSGLRDIIAKAVPVEVQDFLAAHLGDYLHKGFNIEGGGVGASPEDDSCPHCEPLGARVSLLEQQMVFLLKCIDDSEEDGEEDGPAVSSAREELLLKLTRQAAEGDDDVAAIARCLLGEESEREEISTGAKDKKAKRKKKQREKAKASACPAGQPTDVNVQS
jgi:hypothetical protein